MPKCTVMPGVELHYAEDDYTDPWEPADCVLMLHGIGETADAWRAWVPHFARRYRVIRPDLRGFGASTPLALPLDGVTSWTDEVEALVERIGCGRVHVVGAKLGALIGMELGRRRVSWMATLTLAGLLVSPKRAIGPWVKEWTDAIDSKGVEEWARVTMPGRMGGVLGAQASEWWVRLMAQSPAASVKACLEMVSHVGEPEGLEQFTVPTLVMVAGGQSVESSYKQRQSVEAVDALRRRIPRSELFEVPASSYHVAATHPDACAARTLQFIDSHPRGR
jgi:pimeloyl-ACP methyl ester carboxylesterase